jgi:hypothetical protein
MSNEIKLSVVSSQQSAIADVDVDVDLLAFEESLVFSMAAVSLCPSPCPVNAPVNVLLVLVLLRHMQRHDETGADAAVGHETAWRAQRPIQALPMGDRGMLETFEQPRFQPLLLISLCSTVVR